MNTIKRAARALQLADYAGHDTWPELAQALDVAGLLVTPEQQAEVERLRSQAVTQQVVIDNLRIALDALRASRASQSTVDA